MHCPPHITTIPILLQIQHSQLREHNRLVMRLVVPGQGNIHRFQNRLTLALRQPPSPNLPMFFQVPIRDQILMNLRCIRTRKERPPQPPRLLERIRSTVPMIRTHRQHKIAIDPCRAIQYIPPYLLFSRTPMYPRTALVSSLVRVRVEAASSVHMIMLL